MKPTDYRFSIEEIASLLAISGMQEAAKGLLFSNFGQLSADEERGRLVAATHSLFAQQHLDFVDGKPILPAEVSRLVKTITSAQRTIRVGKTGQVGEDVLTYYYYQDKWTESTLSQGIAFRYREIESVNDIQTAIMQFLSPVFLGWRNTEPIILSETIMSDLKPEDRRSLAAVNAFIHKTAPDHPYADALAKDLASALWRGSLLWTEAGETDSIAMRGTLLIQGPDRLWMLNSTSVDGQARMQAQLTSLAQFRQHLHDFVRSDQAPSREVQQ